MGSCGVLDNDVIVITEFYSAKKEDVQGFDESCVASGKAVGHRYVTFPS